ncbi:ABC transporter permease [Paenibacillus graminis]|uniref:Protein lplB n=1 Tax=Paenibacillus graminis TaxID=189425 RepID=A0A089MFP0_9BACL|nr:ABC transporter permease subunit [Paenibacillus graminis]AIQ70308.1 protein lplB [Paenibacillus graminis]
MLRKLRQQRAFHLMLVPSIILVFIFSYLPFYGLVIAFQDYNPGLGFHSPWVGMENFEHVFKQEKFLRTIWNTLYMSIFKLVGGLVVPVIFALLLNEIKHLKRTFQTLVYFPNFLSWVIMAGIMIDILASDGIINTFLSLFGLKPVSFLGNPSIFPWTMIVTDIWKGFGFGTIVYLAALTGIDPGLYEAALIDGAKRWKQTIYITLPLLTPTIILMAVLALGNVLNAGFDQIYNLYSPAVYESGDIIDTYVYRLGIVQAQYSIGTAIGLFKSVITSILVVLSLVLAKKVAGYRIY